MQVVLDLQLPDVSGVKVTRGVLAAYPDAKVVWRAVCDTFKVPDNLR